MGVFWSPSIAFPKPIEVTLSNSRNWACLYYNALNPLLAGDSACTSCTVRAWGAEQLELSQCSRLEIPVCAFKFSQFKCFACLILKSMFIQVKTLQIQQGALASAKISEGPRSVFNLGNEWPGSLILLHSFITPRLNLALHTQILFS